MKEGFKEFKIRLDAKMIEMSDKHFDKTIQTFDFRMILNDENFDTQTTGNIEKSEFIIIDTYLENEEKYIIICFDHKLIISILDYKPFISFLFSENNINKIFFVPNSKYNLLDDNIVKLIEQNENQGKIHLLNDDINAIKRRLGIQKKFKKKSKFFGILSSQAFLLI